MEWVLNGIAVGPFRGLTQERIDKLDFIGERCGVKIFECSDLPVGTMEVWDGKMRVAVIRGLGKVAHA